MKCDPSGGGGTLGGGDAWFNMKDLAGMNSQDWCVYANHDVMLV